MEAVTGVFRSLGDARSAIEGIRTLGVKQDDINLLTPSTSLEEVERSVKTSDTEQPGMGAALGAVLGGVAGIAAGPLGAVALSIALPGVGTVAAIGLYAAAILGAGGAAAGALAGKAAENSMTEGLPKDELFIYEDALRQGRTVVIALADDQDQGDAVRSVLETQGAETIDAARKQWWIGLRDIEKEHYRSAGKDFDSDEESYRRGFEAALHADRRGKSLDQVLEQLKEHHPEIHGQDAFRKGFERGREYSLRMSETEIGAPR